MKKLKPVFLWIVSGCTALLLSLSALAQTDQLQLELGKCAGIADINARVACYDKLVRPLQSRPETSQTPTANKVESATPAKTAVAAAPAPQTAPAATTVAPAPAESATSRMEQFGKQARLESNSKGDESLVGKVSMIKEVELNKIQITLANGQVWQQMIGKSFLLNVNDTVRISPSGWGSSFRLEIDGKPGYIQVSRLR